MNVLVTINCKGPFSTYQAQIEMVSSLKDRGVAITIIGFYSDEIHHFLSKRGIDHYPVYPRARIDSRYIKYVKRITKEKKIDILHVLDGKSLRNCVLAVKEEKVKLVTYFGSASIHWHDPSAYLTYLNPRVDKIICNSTYVFDHVKKQLFRRNKNKTVKIYKGYDPLWFESIPPFDFKTLGIPEDSLVVVLAGTNVKNKRISDFIRSFRYLATHRKVHYVILGRDTNARDLKRHKSQSPFSDHIHLLGLRSDAISLIKGSHLYVQTSLSEGFGRAISEAMSVGKPIVMTDAGGCVELIDKSCGIVIPVKNPRALASAISTLINDNKLRHQMGINARKRIKTKYHINDTIEDTLALYESLK